MKDSQELDKQDLVNLKFGDFFSEGLRLFSKNYGKIILPFILFLLISNLLIVLVLTDLTWMSNEFTASLAPIIARFNTAPETVTEEEMFLVLQSMLFEIGLVGLQSAIGAVFTVLSMCSVSKFLYKKYLRGNANFGKELKKAFNNKLILVIFILGLCVPAGFYFLLIIPGIVLFYYFIFLVSAYNMKDIKNPVKETRLIVKGNFWTLISVFLACVIITAIINFPVQYILELVWNVNASTYSSWLNPDTRNYALLILYQLSYDIVGIMLSPLFICILTPLFATAKARYDLGYQKGYSLQRREYREQPIPYSSYPREREVYARPSERTIAPNISEKKEGMYCPFCGTYIKTPKKFCVKCGESLQFD